MIISTISCGLISLCGFPSGFPGGVGLGSVTHVEFPDINDDIVVDALVKGWMRRGVDSFECYYKKICKSNNDTSECDKSHYTQKNKDFMLVLQSETQSQIHKENPDILCEENTHGVTGYSFYLLSLLVINRFGVGFITGIVWTICSLENTVIWEIMVRSLQPLSIRTNPPGFVSEDDNAVWNGLIRVFPSLLHKLLCH